MKHLRHPTLILLFGGWVLSLALATFAHSPQTGMANAGDIGGIAQQVPTPTLPPGWHRVATRAFSLSLPPGWVFRELMGIDSYVGEFVGDGVRLVFDYGGYSDPLPAAGTAFYEITEERICGRRAKVVRATGLRGDVNGVHFPNASQAIGETPVNKLTIATGALTSAQQDVALAIFRSVCVPGPDVEWEVIEVPGAEMLMAVDMLGPDDGWAVGGSLTDRRRLILHREAGVWQPVSTTAGAPLWQLDMVSPDEGWAVGGNQILRYQDGAWGVEYEMPRTEVLLGLDMASASEGWAATLFQMLHYRNGVWSPTDDPFGATEIHMVSATEGWAGSTSQLRHYRDGAWQAVGWPSAGEWMVNGIDMIVPSDGWIVGGNDSERTGGILHYHDGLWDGLVERWLGPLWAVDMWSARCGWAVGGGLDAGLATLNVYDGEGWVDLPSPFPGWLADIELLSPTEGWAVGTRRDEQGGDHAVLLHIEAPPPTTPTASPTGSGTDTPTLTATPRHETATLTATPHPGTPTPSPSAPPPTSSAAPTVPSATATGSGTAFMVWLPGVLRNHVRGG